MAGLVGLESAWAQRGFACTAVVLLSVINVAGVKWVIKLQFMLLLILLFAGFDFIVGSFTHVDPRMYIQFIIIYKNNFSVKIILTISFLQRLVLLDGQLKF